MVGAIEGLRAGGRLQGVYGLVDGREIGLAAGAKIAAMAKLGQLLQQGSSSSALGFTPPRGEAKVSGSAPTPRV